MDNKEKYSRKRTIGNTWEHTMLSLAKENLCFFQTLSRKGKKFDKRFNRDMVLAAYRKNGIFVSIYCQKQ